MNQLEIPEGYTQGDWSFYNSNGFHALMCGRKTIAKILHQDGDRGFPQEQSHKDAELIRRAPAMAAEIKRLREELEERTVEVQSLKQEKEEMGQVVNYNVNEINRLQSVVDELQRGRFNRSTREDRAFQCLQGLLAHPKWGEHNAVQVAGYALEQADAMLAALAKPQTEADNSELKRLLKLAYGIMGCHHEYSVATGWKGHTCPVCSDAQHTENIRKIQVALGYLKDEPDQKNKQRLPFDLSKALAGEKVVTRDGRQIDDGSFEHIPFKEGYSEIRVCIAGKKYHYDRHGSYQGLKECSPHDIFMEGGV